MMKENKYTLTLRMGGLILQLNTNYVIYFNYLKTYFGKVEVAGDCQKNHHVCINIHLQNESFNKDFSRLKESFDGVMIGPSTFVAKDRVVTIRKVNKKRKILFDYKIKGEELHLTAYLCRKAFKDFVRYNIFGKAQDDLFFFITYPILYYPVFWYLEYFKHTHVLHASAVKCNNIGVIICGLEGIGKTSLALSLLQEKDSCFLSDNLIFYDDKKVYPCHELTRIHKGDNEKIWKGKFEKINVSKVAKDFYSPISIEGTEGLRPKVLIFPQFSSKFIVKEISKSEAASKAIILSGIPAELNNYIEYNSLYNWVVPEFNSSGSKLSTLRDLLVDVRCYEVGMPKSDGLERNSERVKEIIKNAA